MTQEMQSDVQDFVAKLERFHNALPEDQQEMLEAILDAAQAATETSGYMMPNAYMIEREVKDRMATRLREAENDRLVALARRGSAREGGDPTAAGSLFAWLHSWLPALRAQQEPAPEPRPTP